MQNLEAQPVFDPDNVGHSLTAIDEIIPVRLSKLLGTHTGDVESVKFGQGFEIDGAREYVPGDDVRHIDWRLSARDPNERLHVREHMADITPALWIVTDVLRTERYGANPGYYSEQNLALGAALKLMKTADRLRMPTGLIAANEKRVFADKMPKSGRKHVQKTAQKLVNLLAENEETDTEPDSSGLPEQQGTNLALALQRASKLCVRNMIVVISDFRDSFDPSTEEDSWQKPLRQLNKAHNDIIAIETTNVRDFKLPDVVDRFSMGDEIVFLGGKKGRVARQSYEKLAQQQQAAIDKAIAEVAGVHIKLQTENPLWLISLAAQLRYQKRR